MSESFEVIGAPRRKVDAESKVSGLTRYTGDLSLPRMLHCKILRSVHPHARILGIHTDAAAELPGVHAVITGADLPVRYGILPISQDEEPLAVEKVRYAGDPVAAVAAVDEQTAENALRLIRVEYEVLKPIATLEEALQAPKDEKIHEHSERENIHKMVSLEFGDVEAAIAEADLVQEDVFFYQGNTHLAMELHATLAHYEPNGNLTLWISTQTPHYLHRIISEKLGLPASRVRVIAPPTGGGFGGKTEPFSHDLVAAKLAMLTGRPVRIVLTREEVFYAHRGRHPVLMSVRTGLNADGSIKAMHFKTLLDGGAYSSYGVASTYLTGALQTTTYNIPAYKFEGARVYTSKPPCGPKRGHGTPQPRFALEIQVDKIAERLSVNPLDYRLNQLVRPYSKTANHLSITTIGLKECLLAVDERAGFRARYGKLEFGRGLGLAAGGFFSGSGLPLYPNNLPHSSVTIKIDRGGGVTVFSGSTDIGQGSDSMLAYVVAETLGISPEDILVVSSDTALTPVDLGSYASRITMMTGNAALEAAQKLRSQILEAAGDHLQVAADSLVARGHRVSSADDPQTGIPYTEAVVLAEERFGALSATGNYTPPRGGRRVTIGPSPAYSYSSCVVEVTVDPLTGEIAVEKVWIGHDLGRAINPILVEGQIEGCVYMALGETLMEEQVFRRGLHKTPSMLDYKSPTFLETPLIESILIETDDPTGPYGAKEASQGPMLPVIPAIANAIYDAVGVRIDETPITPEKILKGLKLKEKGQDPRIGPRAWPAVPFPQAIRLRSQWGKPVQQKQSAGV